MNTPAHAIVSLLILGDRRRPETGLPLMIGALLPDAPIVAFYAYQKLWQGRAEEWIWSEGYYLPAWQDFFDVFNALPLIFLGWIAARIWKNEWFGALFASMGVHVLGDWPLHHDDGHRHLFPLSDWRFASPVSYWDPAHYGLIVAPIEALFVVVGGLFLLRRYETRTARVWIGATITLYAVYWGFVAIVWL